MILNLIYMSKTQISDFVFNKIDLFDDGLFDEVEAEIRFEDSRKRKSHMPTLNRSQLRH